MKDKKTMSSKNFSDEFLKLKPNYEKLGTNVQQALEIFLNEQEISFLSIKNRVKELNSFLKKIEKKGYKKPLDEIEDICGIRIICYFQKALLHKPISNGLFHNIIFK